MFIASKLFPVCDLPISVRSCPGLAPPNVALSNASTAKLHSLPVFRSWRIRFTCSPLGVKSLCMSASEMPSMGDGEVEIAGAGTMLRPATSCLASSNPISLCTDPS